MWDFRNGEAVIKLLEECIGPYLKAQKSWGMKYESSLMTYEVHEGKKKTVIIYNIVVILRDPKAVKIRTIKVEWMSLKHLLNFDEFQIHTVVI